MYSKTFSAISILSALATINAQGVVQNAKVAKDLQSESEPIRGNYRITNKGTGDKLTYVHDEQANMYPTSKSVLQILKSLGGGSGLAADDVFELKPSFRGDPSTRIRNVPSNKVLSAQWEHDIGRDEYGVAYNCAYGDESECFTDTLEPYKQFWLFIPVDGQSAEDEPKVASTSRVSKIKVVKEDEDESAEEDKKETNDSGCSKPGDWLYRNGDADWYEKHPECEGLAVSPVCTKDAKWLADHPEYVEAKPECAKVLKKAGLLKTKRDHKSIASALTKRGTISPSKGTYYIVSMDHIEDMTTRAITGKDILSFADAISTHMVDFDRNDEDQMWVIEKVD